jgi:hypothetical protein
MKGLERPPEAAPNHAGAGVVPGVGPDCDEPELVEVE